MICPQPFETSFNRLPGVFGRRVHPYESLLFVRDESELRSQEDLGSRPRSRFKVLPEQVFIIAISIGGCIRKASDE
jgi:hypothetical protein